MFFFRSEPRRNFEHYTATTERISKPGQVAATLQRLQQAHCIVDVTIPDFDQHSNSAILRVYPKQGVLIIDELNNKESHQALIRTRKFRASCRLNGVEYRFASIVQRMDRQSGIAMYFVPLPNVILQIQRRRDYRVPVGSDAGLQLHLPRMEGPKLSANLNDLSCGGLSARLNTNSAPGKGQVLPMCSIITPSGDQIRTELEVCFSQFDKLTNAVRIGGHFINMDSQGKKKLTLLVKQLERLHLRNQSS